MLKFMFLIVLGITIFAFRKKIAKKWRKEFGVTIKLITYYGGRSNYYESDDPDEYRFGNKFWFSKRSKRLQYQSGLKQQNSPRQAFATIWWFTHQFNVKRNGAKIISETKLPSDQNGKVGWIWSFDKSPSLYGISAKSQQRILKRVWSSFEYFLVDAWPSKLSYIKIKFRNQQLLDLFERYLLATTDAERTAIKSERRRLCRLKKEELSYFDEAIEEADLVNAVNHDISRKGWVDKKGKKRFDNPKVEEDELPLPGKNHKMI